MDNDTKTLLESDKLRWLRWFITPRKIPATLFEKQQAQQLTFYLFLVAIATIFNFLAWLLIGHLPTFTIFGVIVGIALYGLSRFFYYKTVALITIITTLLLPYLLFWANPADFSIIAAIFCLTLSLLLSSQFLSFKTNLQIVIIVFITTFYFNASNNVYGSISPMSLLVPLLIIIFLSLLNAYGRERILQIANQKEDSVQAEFFQDVIDLMHSPALIQVEQNIIAVNDATIRLIGLQRDEIVGKLVSDYISTEDSTNYKVDNQADRLTISYDDSFQSLDGKIPARITASSISYKDVLATLITITPYETPENLQILEQLMDSSLNGVMVTDADLEYGPHILMVNPALCNMLGFKEAELVGRTSHIFRDSETEQEIASQLRLALDNGTRDVRAEVANLHKDGSTIQVLMRVRPFYNALGELTHYITTQQELNQQDLSEHEDNLSIISEVMTDYAYIFDITSQNTVNFSWMTGAIEDITGLNYDEAMRLNNWRSIVHEDDQSLYDSHIQSLLDGQANTIDYRIWHKDGSNQWIQDKAHPILDKHTGQVLRILGAVHDITEQTNYQETLKTYVVQQAVIAELGLLALNTDNLETLLNHASVLCEQVLHVGFISIFEHDVLNNQLSCIQSSNDNAPFKDGLSFLADSTHSLAGHTLQSSEAVISDNMLAETRFVPLDTVISMGYKSAIGVVILGGNIPFGVLTAYSNKQAYFTHDEVYFLQAIANIIGTFIVRSHAQTAEREQTEFTEALRDATSIINSRLELPEVLNKIITYVRQVVPQTQQATIMLLNEETQRYHFHTTWGFAEDAPEISDTYTFRVENYPLLKVMKETNSSIYIVDTDKDARWVKSNSANQTRSYLGAPIILDEEETIGFINLHGFKVGAFNDKDATRLKTFADKTSTAIVNARKQEDLERKVYQRTQELRQEREQLETIFSGTGDGIFYTENDRIAFVNEALCEMTGFSADELMGQSSTILQVPDITSLEIEKLMSITQSILDNKIWRDTVRLKRKDDTIFEAGLTISRVQSSDSQILRSVTIVRDMSREKALEDLKRVFIAAAAHDLRSPISSLKLRMYMIKKEPQLIDHHLARVTEIIDHVNHLVSDLLDAHGRIVLRPQNIILQEVLDTVVDNLSLEAEQKNMIYDYRTSEHPAPILADENRLNQVFTNLISNAIHYTEPKGSVRIITSINQNKRTVQIDIQDTGNGIPLDEQENIFLPFYRTKGNESKGNGLGLSITREIVELHNGTIAVKSIVGEGSTFTVILPLAELP